MLVIMRIVACQLPETLLLKTWLVKMVGLFGEERVSERAGDESPGPLPTTPPKSPDPDLLVDEDDALDG